MKKIILSLAAILVLNTVQVTGSADSDASHNQEDTHKRTPKQESSASPEEIDRLIEKYSCTGLSEKALRELFTGQSIVEIDNLMTSYDIKRLINRHQNRKFTPPTDDQTNNVLPPPLTL